jgi:uncharacterized protein
MHPHHASHPATLKRLNRAQGHLASVIDIVEAGRPCTERAQQLHTVERAGANAKGDLILDHTEHCLDAGIKAARAPAPLALSEFKLLPKYL